MNRKFPYRYRVQIFLFFLILITYLDRVCISLVGVKIKSEFKLTNEQFGWVLGAFALAYALFEIPSGVLGDRIGQRAVFIRIVLWWSLFTALTGATTGLVTLMGTRFLFGIGESGAFPNSSGTISRWFPATETARSTSWLFIGSNAGAAIAPLIVIPIAAAYGWRAPFFVNGLIGLIWVAVCFLWFKNNPAEMKNITREEKSFIETNRRFINPSQKFPWKAAFKNRSLWALVAAFFCSQWGLYFFLAWMPVYLQEGKHFSETEMQITTSYLFIIGIAGALLTGFLSDWLAKRKGLRFGRRFIAIIALGVTGLSFLVAASSANNMIVSLSLIIGYLFFSTHGVMAYSVCVDIGGDYAGTVAGIMNFFGQIGSFFLAISFGKIADITHSYSLSVIILSIVLFIGSLLWLATDPTKRIVIEQNSFA